MLRFGKEEKALICKAAVYKLCAEYRVKIICPRYHSCVFAL